MIYVTVQSRDEGKDVVVVGFHYGLHFCADEIIDVAMGVVNGVPRGGVGVVETSLQLLFGDTA